MSTPNVNDFVVGLDPTGFTTITGAQLAQLVNSATPSSDRGLVLVSTDAAGVPNVPDASATVEWQRYIWLRVSATYVTAYCWNPGGATDTTYLNWVTLASAAIAPGSIQGYQIANNTIPATAIISLTSSQITGSVVAGWLASMNVYNTAYATNGLMNNNSPIFGVMNGAGSTVATPVFGANVIPSTAFTAQTIAGNAAAVTSPIVDNSIVPRQLAKSAANASTPLTIAAVDPANNVILPTLSQNGIPNVAPSTQAVAVGDVLGVAYGLLGYTTINYSILAIGNPSAANTGIKLPIAGQGTGTYTFQTPSALQGALADTGGGLHPVGRVLQLVTGSYNTQVNCGAAISMSGTVAAFNTMCNPVSGTHSVSTGLTCTITPIAGTAGSKIKLNVSMATYCNAVTNATWIGLWDSVASAWVGYARLVAAGTGTLTIQGITAALTVNTARTYTVYLCTEGANATNGGTNWLGEGSFITAEEYI